MALIEQSKIPQEELDVFAKLKNINVVFDVGARVDIDYLDIHPKATYHLFEPAPEFFQTLKIKVGDRKKVHLNNYGLGDKEEELPYDPGTQSFLLPVTNPKLPLKTLDWYVDQNGITQIDFLKIDTEGFDYKVLAGAYHTLRRIPVRYIQYEHWDKEHKLDFHDLLEEDYIMCYIGFRNVLCIRKGEEWL